MDGIRIRTDLTVEHDGWPIGKITLDNPTKHSHHFTHEIDIDLIVKDAEDNARTFDGWGEPIPRSDTCAQCDDRAHDVRKILKRKDLPHGERLDLINSIFNPVKQNLTT